MCVCVPVSGKPVSLLWVPETYPLFFRIMKNYISILKITSVIIINSFIYVVFSEIIDAFPRKNYIRWLVNVSHFSPEKLIFVRARYLRSR